MQPQQFVFIPAEDYQELRQLIASLQVGTPNTSESAWSVKECATYLNVSTGVVYGLVRDGKIPHFKVGDLVRFHPPKVREWHGTDGVLSKAQAEVGAMLRERGQKRNKL